LYAALKDKCPFTIGIHDIPSLELLRDKLEEMKQQYDVKLKIAKATKTKASDEEEVKRLVQEQKKLAAAAAKDALHKRRVAEKAAKEAKFKAATELLKPNPNCPNLVLDEAVSCITK